MARIKKPLTFSEQVNKLKLHNIIVKNDEQAKRCLKSVNYYRLRGYWISFEKNGRIKRGTTFEDIWQTYLFDCDVRNLLFQMIQPIEIKLKTQIANTMTISCGALSHQERAFFKDEQVFNKFLVIIEKEKNSANGTAAIWVKHNIDNYGDIPIWGMVELMTFGNLSSMYGNLKRNIATKSKKSTVTSEMQDLFKFLMFIFKVGLDIYRI